MSNEVVRSVCYFTKTPNRQTITRVNDLEARLAEKGYEIQTKRVCSPLANPMELQNRITDDTILLSVGTIPFQQALDNLSKFYQAPGVSFNVDLTSAKIDPSHTDLLFQIIQNKPEGTFNFTYVFNNKPSSPYFPSANYDQEGFSIGLQPTNLAEGCDSLKEWLEKIKTSWQRLYAVFGNDPDFLGIDSSVAPIFEGKGSLVNFIKRLGLTFNQSVTTDTYLAITEFIKKNNPKPVGLCGLMMPCLEDFELAEEYEAGNFSIERNAFLSLHSGLGIDTYPMGVDERPERVAEVLRLMQGLSNKYSKPLSVRLVSDGKAKIGDRTDFQNQYLKDVVIKPI